MHDLCDLKQAVLFYPHLPDRETETPALTVSASSEAEPGRKSIRDEGSALALSDPHPPGEPACPTGSSQASREVTPGWQGGMVLIPF